MRAVRVRCGPHLYGRGTLRLDMEFRERDAGRTISQVAQSARVTAMAVHRLPDGPPGKA
jgi:hypothetical protein